jgi:hypothetical protein
MTTKALTCSCKHDVQDEIYGKGRRLHNFAEKKDLFRCTVCENLRDVRDPIKFRSTKQKGDF